MRPNPELILTPQRLEMLKLFERYQFITVKQACELLGASETTDGGGKLTYRAVQSRLHKMYKAHYLKRTAVAQDPTVVRLNPINEFAYYLDRSGVVVATKGKVTTQKSPTSANHDQDLTDFHTPLVKNYPGKVHWEQRNLKRTVNPDAMFGLSKDGGKTGVYFFLEFERSRVNHYTLFPGNSGLVNKVRKYDDYRGGRKQKWNPLTKRREVVTVESEWKLFKDFRLIIIVKDNDLKPQARKKNLLKKLVEMNLAFRFVWIATEKEFLADPMGKVFHTPKDYEQASYSLLDV